jgi:hypothetical protein
MSDSKRYSSTASENIGAKMRKRIIAGRSLKMFCDGGTFFSWCLKLVVYLKKKCMKLYFECTIFDLEKCICRSERNQQG